MTKKDFGIKESMIDIFELLKCINEKEKIFTIEEIKEQSENIIELNENIYKLKVILDELHKKIINNTDLNNTDFRKDMVYLHLAISDIEWQYGQIDELVTKFSSRISNP